MAPTLWAAILPSLKTTRVGMLRMPIIPATLLFAWVLYLTTFTWPSSSSPRASITGAMALQGPHHGAQKSTTTGRSLLTTSVSKVKSVT